MIRHAEEEEQVLGGHAAQTHVSLARVSLGDFCPGCGFKPLESRAACTLLQLEEQLRCARRSCDSPSSGHVLLGSVVQQFWCLEKVLHLDSDVFLESRVGLYGSPRRSTVLLPSPGLMDPFWGLCQGFHVNTDVSVPVTLQFFAFSKVLQGLRQCSCGSFRAVVEWIPVKSTLLLLPRPLLRTELSAAARYPDPSNV